MARSEHLPGVEVAITVDGNDLKEYECDEPSSTPRTTTKYVEATTDKCFEVRVKVDRGFKFAGDGLSASVAVDGVHVEALRINEFNAVICVGERKGQGRWENGQLRRYQFAGIEIAEDYRMAHQEAEDLADLGTIQVTLGHVERAEFTRYYDEPATSADDLVAEAPGNGVVSEKAVKGRAISHAFRLAEPEGPRPATGKSKIAAKKKPGASSNVMTKRRKLPEPVKYRADKAVPGVPWPAAVFKFKYRSLDALKLLLIVPRTPTPPPLEDRDANDLSVEELRELHRKSQAARASLPHTRPDPFIADCFAQKEQQAGRKIKEEEEDSGERKRRKIARPTATSTQLTIDDDGNIREESNQAGRASQVEVIELD